MRAYSVEQFWGQGVTLVELLVVLAIVSVLATLGFVHLPQDRVHLREASRILQADLMRARSEAIRYNTFVAVAFDPAGGDYRMFIDADRNKISDTGALLPLASSLASFPRARLSAVNFTGSDTLWLDPRGLPRNASGAFAAGSVTFTSSRNTRLQYRVIVASHGRVRIEASP